MSGPISLDRPVGAVVLRELSGEVAAAPADVFAELVARVGAVAGSATDAAARRVVVQGGYWYRGEYVVEKSATGSIVRLTIVNVAPGPKVLGALTGRSVLREAPRAFATLLASVGGQRST